MTNIELLREAARELRTMHGLLLPDCKGGCPALVYAERLEGLANGIRLPRTPLLPIAWEPVKPDDPDPLALYLRGTATEDSISERDLHCPWS